MFVSGVSAKVPKVQICLKTFFDDCSVGIVQVVGMRAIRECVTDVLTTFVLYYKETNYYREAFFISKSFNITRKPALFTLVNTKKAI